MWKMTSWKSLSLAAALFAGGFVLAQDEEKSKDKPNDKPAAQPSGREGPGSDRRPGEGRPGEGRPGGFGGPGGFGAAGGLLRNLPVMAALDADKDGTISASELEKATTALKALDKNADGKLTEDELRPSFGPGGGGFGGGFGGGGFGGGGFGGGRGTSPNPEEFVERSMQNDKNKDGKLSKDELPERMVGLLDRGDLDRDGFLSKEELLKSVQRNAENPPGGRGGFGRGEPGRGEPGRGEPGRGGDAGRPFGQPNPEMMIENALRFDEDKDGKLSKDELRKMFEGFGRGGRPAEGRGDRPQRPATED